ncbi:hypothetical protein JCM21531_3416 [Acetivibrio straminisolvens JCM 21531]|uniref:AMMECR1 domain-containing protein n=1 Tax=Acetivibrio straminisolvens JCM 21531 TaxID=1294263 RepID=W4V8Y1_9FIRM|nr:hypothetical protein JCM21531_3416 [Acetivibrio straminisolvens JCM 21531]
MIVPEIGKGDEKGAQKTIEACEKAAEEIRKEKPSTIILTTSHAPLFEDYFFINDYKTLKGDFGRFGARQVKLSFENNFKMAESIIEFANEKGFDAGGINEGIGKRYGISGELDHGALVPLYYISRVYSDFKLVHIAMSTLTLEEHYKFGMCIGQAVRNSDENVVFVSSGDLAHKLKSDGPYGYNKHAGEFDELFVKSIEKDDIDSILDINDKLRDEAAECGLRSFVIMLGALDGYSVDPKVYSYEGPFGVGYMVARIGVGEEDTSRRIIERRIKGRSKSVDPYVSLARKALETYVREGKVLDDYDGLPEEMTKERAGTFVSIKKKGELRGCIGTIAPTRENIAKEIIHNAISSGTADPRFYPVKPYELDELDYSVDVLMEPEAIDSIDKLDVLRYGVIVRAGRRTGLLLPNLENVDTPKQQVSIALQKAGIGPNEDYTMERFEVIRHK